MALNYITEVVDSRGGTAPPPSGTVVTGIYEPKLTPGVRAFTLPDGSNWHETSAGSGTFRNQAGAIVKIGSAGGAPKPVESGGGGGHSAGYGSGLSGPPGGWFNPDNIYFPQLVQDYDRPSAQNWSRFMPSGGLLSENNGLLYQPWTSNYAKTYGGIMDYEPPQIRTGLPTYIGNPYGSLTLPPDWESLLDISGEEEGSEE